MVLLKTFFKRHIFKCLSLSTVLPICWHVCFALLTAGVVVGSVGGCRPDTATKPNNESSRSERGFIHFIFLWLDSALDRAESLFGHHNKIPHLHAIILSLRCAAEEEVLYTPFVLLLMFPPTYLHISTATHIYTFYLLSVCEKKHFTL